MWQLIKNLNVLPKSLIQIALQTTKDAFYVKFKNVFLILNDLSYFYAYFSFRNDKNIVVDMSNPTLC